jgi:excisionase family DNA binding protein
MMRLARPRRSQVDNLELWTVDEVARRLKLARSRVYTLIMSGELESINIAKLRRAQAVSG